MNCQQLTETVQVLTQAAAGIAGIRLEGGDMSKYLLEEMTWPEAEAAFAEGRVVIMPVGSTEQHGPHLPLGTDFFTAREMAVRVAERGARVIVTPVLPFGYAEYHTDFAGTLSLRHDTYVRVLTELTDNLVKHGATHILFLNGHGGNGAALSEVGLRLRTRGVVCGMLQWWDVTSRLNPDWGFGHGDYYETSLMLEITPGLVDISRIKTLEMRSPLVSMEAVTPWDFIWDGGLVHVYLGTRDITTNGDLLEHGKPAAGANRELGRQLAEAFVAFVCRFIEEFSRIRLQ